MELVRIEGKRTATEFQGKLLASVTTYSPDRPRWFEMKLWQHQNGGWVVDRASVSTVYHASDTDCLRRDGRQKGQPWKVGDLPSDAGPCDEAGCGGRGEYALPHPGAMSPETTVRFEAPRHTVIHCPTARDVIEAVTVDRTRPSQAFASGPATELLQIAAGQVPEIAAALSASGTVSSVKVE